jgi:hypothetical protein
VSKAVGKIYFEIVNWENAQLELPDGLHGPQRRLRLTDVYAEMYI